MSDTAGQVSDETLAELRRLAAEATPGPWAWDADGDSYMGCGEVFTWGEGVEGGNIAAPSGDLYPRSGYAPQADMKFIATMDPPTTLALLDALDAARSEVERLSKYAPSPEVEALLERSSFGAEEAKAARESVSPDVGRLIVRLSQVMAERDATLADIAAEVLAGIKTHNDTPVTAENLDYAATHEALCRSWIGDVLRGLSAALSTANDNGATSPHETAPNAAQGNLAPYSTTSGIPLERLESFSGEWPTSGVLLDGHFRALPPGRYYKLQSQWLPVDVPTTPEETP